PQSTIEFVDHLHNFIMFAMEDAVARSEYQRPMYRGFMKAMARLVETASLRDYEARTLGYLLLGMTYEQIAGETRISVNTVRKHITNVYKKSGVHSLNELYAKYFLPWPG